MFLNITLYHYLVVGNILLFIGVLGILVNKKSLITAIMSLEIMLLSININLVAFSNYLNDITGQIFVLIIMAVAAAEVSVGLAIILIYFRNNNKLWMNEINSMKG